MQAVPIRILGRRDSSTSEFVTEQMDQDMRDIMRYTRLIERFLRDIEYIGAMRVSPSRTHLFTGERRTRIGADGQNAPNILAMDSARRGSRRRGIAKMVSEWLKKAGIASDFVVHPISDRHYEIRVQHPVTKEYQNLADVGYGNSQIMPVLIGGYNLVRGATYLVEEPEIHLHPRAQAELGDFLLDLYHGGIQSIVETHSEHLILRLQQHVARKVIPKDHIRFYYIYASNKKKIAKPLRLDELGRFIDDWPQGFFPERLEEAKKLAQVRFESERSGE
jgi:predicted ATPase